MILTKLTGKIWGNANVTKKDEMKKIPGVTSSDRVKKCQNKERLYHITQTAKLPMNRQLFLF